MPGVGLSACPGGRCKHIDLAYNHDDGLIYFCGGDHADAGGIANDSGRQEMYTYSIAEDRWTKIQPYCRTDGTPQPMSPTEVGWAYDNKRKKFWFVPGFQWNSAGTCPNSNAIKGISMHYDPAMRTWSLPNPPIAVEPTQGSHDGDHTVYDPMTDSLIRVVDKPAVEMYSCAANVWRTYGFTGPAASYHDVRKTIDVQGRRVYFLAGGTLWAFNLDTHITSNLGASPAPTNGENNPIWDPVNKVLLWPWFMDVDNSAGLPSERVHLHIYHPDNGRWDTDLPYTAPANVQVKGRHALFDPQQNALMVFGNTWNTPYQPYVFIYRYESPLDDIKPGEWRGVGLNRIRDVLPNPLPPGDTGPSSIITAWGSAAFDSRRNRYVIALSGGHGDYAGNEIYAFDLATLKWSRIWGPTPNSLIPDPIQTPNVNCAGLPPTTREVYYDCNPSSRHNYDGVEYLPNVDKLFSQGGSYWSGSGGFGPGVWTFDFDALAWTRCADAIGYPNAVPFTAYDPMTGHVFTHRYNTLGEYDPVANIWTKRGGYGAGIDPGATAVLDPKRRKFLLVGGGAIRFYDLNVPNTQLALLTTTGDTAPVTTGRPGVEYDPLSDRIVAWIGGTDVYSLNMDTLVWTKISAASTNHVLPTSPAPNGTFGRWRYIPSKNIFMVVNSIDQDVYVYNLSGAAPRLPAAPTNFRVTQNDYRI